MQQALSRAGMEKLQPLVLVLSLLVPRFSDASGVLGVNYGRVANNLPSPDEVVQLLSSTSTISKVKLFDADKSVLTAFSGSRFELVVGFPNERIRAAATRPSTAARWIKNKILPFVRPKSSNTKPTRIGTIAVGNEVLLSANSTGSSLTSLLVPAMYNLHSALAYYSLDSQVKLSSPIPLSVLSVSYPPSSGSFHSELPMKQFLNFLSETGSYVMINAYPFFAYEFNPGQISLDYALFNPNAGVQDPQSGLVYSNLLDAQLDAVYSAMSKLGYNNLDVVVSETGWPNNGDQSEAGASVSNAAAYNGNLIRRIRSNTGTPSRPSATLEAFIFALFNENMKPGPGSERNYGLFYPDKRSVYNCGLLHSSDHNSTSPSTPGTSPSSPEANKPSTPSPSTVPSKTWCVAKNGVSGTMLQKGLDYACGNADCAAIQTGQACFLPNTIEAHASYAFNSYYQQNVNGGATCDFTGAAVLTTNNPSYGACEFPLMDKGV